MSAVAQGYATALCDAEILAHLAYLEVRNQVERVRDPSGVLVWRLTEL